jgi:phosphoribosylamine--glycine ligase
MVSLAERLKPDFTVVGPEGPLVAGVVDEFMKAGFKIVGPSRAAAQLEGSKIFAKQFMVRHGIPTASVHGIFDSAVEACAAVGAVEGPVVIKADGLCAGKGVLVTSSRYEAAAFLERLLVHRDFGESGCRVLVEEGLEGEELSYIVLTDGEHVLPFVPSRDHKRMFDGNRGPNTGGMGAYSSDNLMSKELNDTILLRIVKPTINGLRQEGWRYKGFLYFGLMITKEGPKVLEYNCRLGDPETQAILLRMDFDLADALSALLGDKLHEVKGAWKEGGSVVVVLASEGYPRAVISGKSISGLSEATKLVGAKVFHAATRLENAMYYTCGGRVLGVACAARSVAEASRKAYVAVGNIRFEGMQFRTDIGNAEELKGIGAAGNKLG